VLAECLDNHRSLDLAHYPIAGVGEVEAPALLFFMPDKSGFFYFLRPVFGGDQMSLYALENDLIRPRFSDPRIHFALNCASARLPAPAPARLQRRDAQFPRRLAGARRLYLGALRLVSGRLLGISPGR
jgi:hypothetical protein